MGCFCLLLCICCSAWMLCWHCSWLLALSLFSADLWWCVLHGYVEVVWSPVPVRERGCERLKLLRCLGKIGLCYSMCSCFANFSGCQLVNLHGSAWLLVICFGLSRLHGLSLALLTRSWSYSTLVEDGLRSYSAQFGFWISVVHSMLSSGLEGVPLSVFGSPSWCS